MPLTPTRSMGCALLTILLWVCALWPAAARAAEVGAQTSWTEAWTWSTDPSTTPPPSEAFEPLEVEDIDALSDAMSNRVLWLSHPVIIEPAQADEALAFTIPVRAPARAFLDGVPLTVVGSDDTLSPAAGVIAFDLPPGTTGAHRIAIRTEVAESLLAYSLGRIEPTRGRVGPRDFTVPMARTTYLAEGLSQGIPSTIIAALMLAGALVSIIIGLRLARARPVAMYGLVLLFSAVWSGLVAIDTATPMALPLIIGLSIGVSHVITALSHEFIWPFLVAQKPPWWWRTTTIGCIFCAALYMSNAEFAATIAGPPWHELIAVTEPLSMLGLAMWAAWGGSRRGRIVLAGISSSTTVYVYVLVQQIGWLPQWAAACMPRMKRASSTVTSSPPT